MTTVEKYMQHLDGIFQLEPLFFTKESKTKGIAGVSSLIYENVPEEGFITGLTYGLSLVEHPSWEFGRPELCISVKSQDQNWGNVAGYIANEMRGDFDFSYGQIIDFGQPIADDSEMSAFFIFAPSILDSEDYRDIEVGSTYKINLAGLYPIYKEEMDLFEKIGLEEFWHHPEYDLYDVQRPRIKGL